MDAVTNGDQLCALVLPGVYVCSVTNIVCNDNQQMELSYMTSHCKCLKYNKHNATFSTSPDVLVACLFVCVCIIVCVLAFAVCLTFSWSVQQADSRLKIVHLLALFPSL